ncbi:hypothetical protein HMPREF9056_01355 [Actinomyces sp. oral taxon 170 str. F0386]|nr:hypothetical protein HMPREF9056_01355 [Actinomyces sp. oral taxon 170 str. F0386]
MVRAERAAYFWKGQLLPRCSKTAATTQRVSFSETFRLRTLLEGRGVMSGGQWDR